MNLSRIVDTGAQCIPKVTGAVADAAAAVVQKNVIPDETIKLIHNAIKAANPKDYSFSGVEAAIQRYLRGAGVMSYSDPEAAKMDKLVKPFIKLCSGTGPVYELCDPETVQAYKSASAALGAYGKAFVNMSQ